jgi:excisionase family DNA binding protein
VNEKLGRILLKPSEVADALAVSRSYAYALMASGEIPTVTIGGSRRVVLADLNAWIESKKVPQSTPEGA